MGFRLLIADVRHCANGVRISQEGVTDPSFTYGNRWVGYEWGKVGRGRVRLRMSVYPAGVLPAKWPSLPLAAGLEGALS